MSADRSEGRGLPCYLPRCSSCTDRRVCGSIRGTRPSMLPPVLLIVHRPIRHRPACLPIDLRDAASHATSRVAHRALTGVSADRPVGRDLPCYLPCTDQSLVCGSTCGTRPSMLPPALLIVHRPIRRRRAYLRIDLRDATSHATLRVAHRAPTGVSADRSEGRGPPCYLSCCSPCTSPRRPPLANSNAGQKALQSRGAPARCTDTPHAHGKHSLRRRFGVH